jgi:hypothetical protein
MTARPGRRATLPRAAGNVLSMQNGDASATLHDRGHDLLGAGFGAARPADGRPDADADPRAALEAYRAWSAAGRPGAVPHAEARRLLLGDAG